MARTEVSQDGERKWTVAVIAFVLLFIITSFSLILYFEFKVSETPCENEPCHNGGICIQEGELFTCDCPLGYSGSKCEETPCVGDPCLNEETCTINGSSHLCSCLPKYTEISLEENGNCGIDNDCADNTTCPSGIYKLHLTNISEVYCDINIDNGGWIVFQRRVNGKVNFYRDWNCYKYGFGDLNSEFWLGKELIHEITKDGNYMLRIDLEDLEGETRSALYSNFILEDANSDYTLRVSGYSGNAGDSLAEHNDKQFSTKDRNNIDCAIEFQGAWWYNGCHHSNLNGQYLNGTHSTYADGINWFDWRGYYYSLKKTSMMIRRK